MTSQLHNIVIDIMLLRFNLTIYFFEALSQALFLDIVTKEQSLLNSNESCRTRNRLDSHKNFLEIGKDTSRLRLSSSYLVLMTAMFHWNRKVWDSSNIDGKMEMLLE